MSDPPPLEKDHTVPLSYPALKSIFGKFDLWKRDELMRNFLELKTISHQQPSHITSFLIDCSDADTYVFSVGRESGDTLWFQFNDATIYKSQTQCALELAEDSFPTRFPNKNQTLQNLASIYLNMPNGYYADASIKNLSADILTKKFNFDVLRVSPGSGGDPEFGPLRLFLDQVDSVQDVYIEVESADEMTILTHPFFERQRCTIDVKEFNLERWALVKTNSSFINPDHDSMEDDMSYESYMNLAQRFVETRDVGFKCTIALSKDCSFEIIERIFSNGIGWQFKPQNDTLAVAYIHYNKEIHLIYSSRNYLDMTIGAISPESQFPEMDAFTLLQININILSGNCEQRAWIKQKYPWEPCLPYKFEELVVNFRKLEIFAKTEKNQIGSVMEFNSKKAVRNQLHTLASNSRTHIKNLTICGTDKRLGDPKYRNMISATNLRLLYKGVHSESFFDIFKPFEKLETFIVSSREAVQHCNFTDEAHDFKVLNEEEAIEIN